jgi:hypothetical protein
MCNVLATSSVQVCAQNCSLSMPLREQTMGKRLAAHLQNM